MENNNSDGDILQNLKDGGCDIETIMVFIDHLKKGKLAEGLKLLAVHRRSLLDNLHKDQKQIDCLDYLIFKMKKQV